MLSVLQRAPRARTHAAHKRREVLMKNSGVVVGTILLASLAAVAMPMTAEAFGRCGGGGGGGHFGGGGMHFGGGGGGMRLGGGMMRLGGGGMRPGGISHLGGMRLGGSHISGIRAGGIHPG